MSSATLDIRDHSTCIDTNAALTRHFPLSHTRQYIHRNESAGFPANVIVGSQSDFEYDALAQLSFADADAFDTFWALCQQPGNAERIAADEEQFLDRPRCKYFIHPAWILVLGVSNSGFLEKAIY